MSGHVGDLHGKTLLLHPNNFVTTHTSPRPELPVGPNDGVKDQHRFVLPLLVRDVTDTNVGVNGFTGADNDGVARNHINRILKALKGAGLISHNTRSRPSYGGGGVGSC